MGKKIKLNTTQLIALKTCQTEIQRAQQQLLTIQKEIGLDANKDYSVSNEGVITELAKGDVNVSSKDT